MRLHGRVALALTLLLASSPASAVKPPAGPGGVRMLGEAVEPRTIEFSALPRRHGGPVAGAFRENHPEGVWPEAEQELEQLKRHPKALRVSDLGSVTLDRGIGAFRAMAPTAGNGFEGIFQGPYIPSEPTVGAGPLNIFTMGNVSVTVTNKDGTLRQETDGALFFGIPMSEGAISDAQCYYDALRGRFVALAFTQGTSPSNFSNFYLAVSKTNDARGAWWVYKYDMTKDGVTSTNNWSDYESLGISDDKLAMTGQQFTFNSNQYQYQKIRVLDRAQIYAGTKSAFVDIVNFAPPPGGNTNDVFVTKSARNLTAGDNTLHMLCVRTNGGTNVTYREVTGSPSSPSLSAGVRPTVGSYSAPPDAVQLNGTRLVATNDCRPGDFYVRNGVLICSWHTAANFGSGTVSALRLFRLRTSDQTVLTDETYGADGIFYYYPAVTVDSVGTIFLGFDRSSSSEFPSAYATGKRRSDATLEPSTLLKAGQSNTVQSRWGDFTGMDNDASLAGPGGSTAWYAGQWTRGTNTFGTWINRLTFTYGQIAGSVLDDCDGSTGTTTDRTAIAGATVALKQGATTLATTTSDAGGAYNFGFLETGVYDVVVTPPGGDASLDAVPGTGGNAQTRVSATDVQVDVTNAQTSTANVFLLTTTHPAPATSSISPTSKTAGDTAFVLTVNGSSFVRCSVVQVDGSPRPTTYVNASQLMASILASDIAVAGTRSITVLTPAAGGGTSGAQSLTVNSGDVTPPTVTVTSPNGGETWKAGSSHAITWTANDNVGVTAVDLAYSTDGGTTFPNAIASGLANSGTYAWSVPNAPGTTLRVRATAHDAATNTAADASDGNFTIDRWLVTSSASGGGSIAPLGAIPVVEGATQGFTMTPDPGHHAVDVLVDGSSVGAVASYSFTNVTANHTIAASFVLDTFTVTASAGTHGTIAPSGAVKVARGSDQAFTITPDAGWHVLDVLVDGSSAGAVTGYTFTNVTANHTISASFALDVHTITASAGAHGTIAPSGAVPVSHGSDQAFTITPDANYHVADVLVDGSSAGAVTGYTFTNVVANHTIAASFAVDQHTLTVIVSGSGSVAKAPNLASYPHGSTIVLTATPAAGWGFIGWSGALTSTANPDSIVILADASVTAAFADTAAPAITVTSPNGGENLLVGSSAPLTWASTDNVAVSAIDLFLSRAGIGGPYDTLAVGIANSGSYSWSVTGPPTTTAILRAVAHDAAGNSRADLSDAAFTISGPLGADDGPVTAFALLPARPNPMHTGGQFGFALPRASTVRLAILDVQGREVELLANGEYAAGRHHFTWSNRDSGLGAGLYFVRLRVAGRTFTSRFVLAR